MQLLNVAYNYNKHSNNLDYQKNFAFKNIQLKGLE